MRATVLNSGLTGRSMNGPIGVGVAAAEDQRTDFRAMEGQERPGNWLTRQSGIRGTRMSVLTIGARILIVLDLSSVWPCCCHIPALVCAHRSGGGVRCTAENA